MARKKAQSLPRKTITVYAEILQETEKAILVRCDAEADGAWLPKSQIQYDGECGDTNVEIQIPELLADEKGFLDGQGYIPSATVAAVVSGFAEILKECTTCKYSDGDAATDCAQCRDCDEDTFSSWETTQEAASPEDAGDNTEPGASTVPGDRHWLKQETITVTQQLTQKEKAEYAEEMAQLDNEIEELEDERDSVMKSLKKQIDAKEDERRKLSKVVRCGNEEREIYCDKLADYNTCEMVWTDAHPPHDEVKRQKMTAEERQLPLEKKAKPDHTAVNAEVADLSPDAGGMDFDALTLDAETEKTCKTCLHDEAVNDDGEPCESCDEHLSLWQPKPDDTRHCSNCANLHRTFVETDTDPCHLCTDEGKENWVPMSTDTAIPAGEQPDTHSGLVQ